MHAAPRAFVQFDVVVVGASVTGSAVATLAREAGLSVALVDARAREELDRPRRPTPVPVWALDESRLPVGEVMRVPARVHLVAAEAKATLATPDCVMLEPGALIGSLVERTTTNGGVLFDRTRVLGLAPHGEGIRTAAGSIAARFVVDASGADGACLLGERVVEPGDIASVAHETRRIHDGRLADAYLEAIDAERGESVAFLAPSGAGSLVVARVDEDAHTISIHSVVLGDDHRRPTARAAIRRLAHGLSWIGEPIAEDTRHVALAGLRRTLATGSVALAGGAAGMTRPGLGGEETFGLVSARLLVDVLAKGGDLTRYERRVRARFERIMEMDAAIAKTFRTLEETDLAAMLRDGAIGEGLLAMLLEQRLSRLAALRFNVAAAVRSGRAAIVRALDEAAAWPALHHLNHLNHLTPRRTTNGGGA